MKLGWKIREMALTAVPAELAKGQGVVGKLQASPWATRDISLGNPGYLVSPLHCGTTLLLLHGQCSFGVSWEDEFLIDLYAKWCCSWGGDCSDSVLLHGQAPDVKTPVLHILVVLVPPYSPWLGAVVYKYLIYPHHCLRHRSFQLRDLIPTVSLWDLSIHLSVPWTICSITLLLCLNIFTFKKMLPRLLFLIYIIGRHLLGAGNFY